MTIQDRLAWAYRVSVLNLVMNLVVGGIILSILIFGFAGGIAGGMRGGFDVPGVALFAIPVVLFIALLILASLLLPLVVMTAIKKKTENWAIAAYIVLLYEIVTGGGFLILPIVTLVFLFDQDTHEVLMGRKKE
jgi:hypothetical protein